ncbi:hypothetical protein RRG08_002903 [Elysia crispata]|uniref:Apple domain-containing protein n=1 Tax=Elysia crispata TaxID=231223 RepID=A0AAE1APF6_9GAST|nr:hypothetical protein RRG08_002903 [Elysia crispata]
MTRLQEWLPLLLCLVFIDVVGADDFQCEGTYPSAAGGSVPHMPTVTKDSDSYQATVEVNILDKNYSFVIDEFLDYEGNRALLRVYKRGVQSSSIFSYDTDEVFSITNGLCSVSNISESRFGFVFGDGSQTTGDRRHVFASAAVLRFAADKHDVYNGTSQVRGIPADVYSTCINWQGVVGKARVTYYFSQFNWNTSAPRQQLPLRIEVEGLSSFPMFGGGPPYKTTQSSKPRYFHHIYDFINYLPYIADDPSIFLTPPNVVCEKRVVTKTFPKFGKFVNVRHEEIDPLSGNIEHRHLWYDQEAKMVRMDYRWDPPGSGQYTNGITSIGDFNTGIEYTIDHIKGCTIGALKTKDPGVDTKQKALDGTDFFTVDFKDPNTLFYLNENYIYVGKRKVRSIMCDVFIAAVSNYTIEGTQVDVTFEYHFLAGNWHDIPIDASMTTEGIYPVQLVINAPERYWTKVYNFYDFSDKRPLSSDFDVSSCFGNSQRVEIQLTFPGSIDSNAWDNTEFKERLHYQLAEVLQLNPVRIAGVRISRDYQNIFVKAWLLSTVNAAQFEKLSAQSMEKMGDTSYTRIQSFSECADSCINHKDFQCNGFLFCAQDNTCRLSKLQVVTGDIVTGGVLCDAYSRTTSGPAISQPSLSEAYNTLTAAVQQKKVQVTLKDAEGFEPPPFTAITVQVTSGALIKDKPMPNIPQKFFYRVESVLPSLTTVVETYMWYDGPLKLFRYDTRYLSQLQETTIHDFNTGVAYKINQVTKECTVSTIGMDQPDTVKPSNTNGSRVNTLAMKNAMDLLFIDGSYKYIGQSTVRGIPCDVFETRRTDYKDRLSNSNQTNQITIFKYYFQVDNWKYFSAEAMDITKGQMVRLDIEDRTTNDFRTYNIFDFNDEHHAYSFYDTSACFEPDQRKSFAIIFKDQSFHPTLDAYSATFLNSALLEMSKQTLVSPIRFQKASVTYDDSSIYLLVTALGTPPPLALFYKLGPVARNTSAPQELALFADDCAASCVESKDFLCYSFDFCDADSDNPSCLLSGYRLSANINSQDGSNSAASSLTCTRYIRSENVTGPRLSSERIFQILTDVVYDNMFEVSISPPNEQVFSCLCCLNSDNNYSDSDDLDALPSI